MRSPLVPDPAAPRSGPVLSRRAVLLGAGAAGAAVLVGCSDPTASPAGSTTTAGAAGAAGAGGPGLAAIFDQTLGFALAGKPQRFAFAVLGADRVPTKDAPASLDMTVSKLTVGADGKATGNGTPIGPPITVPRHADGVPIAYFPLRFTPDAPGYYQVSTTIDGTPTTSAFQVGTAADTKQPQVGDKLLSVDTPTTTDHRGVDPICTRTPEACSLHDSNLVDTIRAGKPMAFLISTPQFCQIGVCGPVLELLLEAHTPRRDTFNMVHAEVYKKVDPKTGISQAELAPAVQAYNITYEPALFVARPDGTIVERLDNVFDRAEIKDALDKAAA